MQSHELLQEVFREAGVKRLAAELGLSISALYKWAEPRADSAGSGNANPLDRVETLLRTTDDERLIQWLCQRANGFFIRNPRITAPHPEYLIPATNRVVEEFADLLAVVAKAASDNDINPDEAVKIRARWEELKSATEGFVTCCEQGNFRTLKQQVSALAPAPAPRKT